MNGPGKTADGCQIVLDAPGGAAGEDGVRVARDAAGSPVLSFSGDWTLGSAGFRQVRIVLPLAEGLAVDCSGLRSWDSRFLAAVLEVQARLAEHGRALPVESLPEGARRMLAARQRSPESHREETASWPGFRAWLGEALRLGAALGVLEFVGEALAGLCRFLAGRSVARGRDVVEQVYRTGPSALPIISLISFLMGVILAFIGSIPLRFFGAEVFIATLLGVGILRLMAPVMVGIVMAGRTGAAFAAELGTMVVNEELDAMRTFGIPAFEFLVVPRCVAMMLMLPLLGLFADLVGILGGMTVGMLHMDLGRKEFLQQLVDSTSLSDLFVGLFTCWVFGLLVALCGCRQGLGCGRDAAAVGKATTSAVVGSIVCIVVATAVITVLTVNLKI